MAPNYPPAGAANDYPSPAASRRPSECFSEMSMSGSRRGSLAGFASDMESKGQWQSIGSESKSPLAQFGFFKSLTEKKTTRDGQPPKRRGPKPDSKPAMTRRQELNRQAQRTHRERKEMYIKALEQEVIRLKDTFAATSRERDAFAEENRKLRELLMAHGISFDLSSPTNGMGHMGTPSYGSSSGSVSGYGPGSASTDYTSPPQSLQHRGSISHDALNQQPLNRDRFRFNVRPNALSFSSTPTIISHAIYITSFFSLHYPSLERPCMDHMQFLMVRAHDADETISGHALMATAPPDAHIANCPQEKYPHQMPDVKMPDLMKLLDLSNRLPLDGEITPIMAWAKILQDEKFRELSKEDIERIKEELLAKVRCYGFGAVLEEFEVSDALMTVLAGKYSNGNPTPAT
ncbi:Nn.00g056160.m01.CDS01 [Neocucurbitaria sp. VM-36]